MKQVSSKSSKRSEQIVIRKVIISFVLMAALLLVSNLTMSYVATEGFSTTAENVLAIMLIEPLQELDRSSRSLIATYKMIAIGNADEGVKLLDKITEIKQQYNNAFEKLNAADLSRQNIDLNVLKNDLNELNKNGEEMVKAYISDEKDKGLEYRRKVEEDGNKIEKEVTDILKSTFESISSSGSKMRDFFKFVRTISFVLMAISVLLALIIVASIIRGIRSALSEEQKNLKEKITDVVLILSHNTENLATTSTDLNEANEKLATSSEEQAREASQVVSAIQEMTSIVQGTLVKQAEQSSEISNKTQLMAKAGRDAVQKIANSMAEIQVANQKLTEIVDLMKEITTKTNVINDIVFQTKLLSFNASVEAARAGEHGKGFAVVAGEIGSLAEQSGQSAQAINQLLNDGNQKVNAVVYDIQERTRTAEGILDEFIDAFTSLESLNNSLNQAISKITTATNEVGLGIENTATSIAQIDKAINLNSKIALDSKERASNVKHGSNELSSAVDSLRSIIN